MTDKDGGTTTVSGGTLVVFDPAAGSVSGAGSLADPSHDLVLFDFEARYRDHDSDPSGHVELHVPHLTLFATDLDWLVVTSPSFVLQGHGRVLDHHGSYRFRLSGVTGHPGPAARADLGAGRLARLRQHAAAAPLRRHPHRPLLIRRGR